jgi:hypothetical protein
MFRFTEDEGLFFSGRHAVGKDEKGRVVLVGLTSEETRFYIACLRHRHLPVPERASVRRFFSLHEKHEAQREALLGAFAGEQRSSRAHPRNPV